MSDETTPDKSPRSPNYALQDALDDVRKLHSQIGKASVKPESAAIALGYKGLNGAALTTLGTLSQYGLIERSKGAVSITPLAVRILHPLSDAQLKEALREAALAPRVFRNIHENLSQCSVDVLTSHLVQDGFTPDRAKRAATVYAANKGFANLDDSSTIGNAKTDPVRTETQKTEDAARNQKEHQSVTGGAAATASRSEATVLAQYTIPLGQNEATLVFTGRSLSVDDFDALIDFVTFSKRQFERAEKSRDSVAAALNFSNQNRRGVPVDAPSAFPKTAMWRNKDHDKPVTITGVMGEKDGQEYYQSSEGTGIPASELRFDDD